MTDLFVSYKSEDRDYVMRLVPMLEAAGFSVWWDDQITPRTAWDSAIESAIGQSKCVLVLWSSKSVQSRWVNIEAHYANDRGKLLEAKIEPCDVPLAFALNQHLDLTGWRFERSDRLWQKLVSWVADFCSDPSSVAIGKPERQAQGHATLLTFASGEPVFDGAFVSQTTPAGTLFADSIGLPVMRVIPAGRCVIGALPDDCARQAWEEPQRGVTLARPFALSAFPVLGGEYQQICPLPVVAKTPEPPSRASGLFFWKAKEPKVSQACVDFRADYPMHSVSAIDAENFCEELSQRTGQTYRLPSEAEWEYACRSGSRDVFSFGSSISEDQALFEKPASFGLAIPGQYPANAFGLFDMSGNIREWVQDYWHDSLAELSADGRPRLDGHSAMRVTRGGAWSDPRSALRSSARGRAAEDMRSKLIGFRVVREL